MKQIPLTQGKFALVDDEDYEFLMQWKWQAHNDLPKKYRGNEIDRWYVWRSQWNKQTKQQDIIRMHRLIMSAPKDKIVDHIDGNGLNNVRTNLRLCTQAENNRNRRKFVCSSNRSKFKGVTFEKRSNRSPWKARIKVNGKDLYLGHFASQSDAARAYNIAAMKYHGIYANLNIID